VRSPRFSLNITSMCGKLTSPIMEVAGTVSWILAQKNSAVWTVRPDALVYDAIKMMADKNVGALPVMQNDKLVGIVSERDYTRKVILLGRSSKETRVSEIMSTDLVVTHPNESLTGCMHMMTDKRVRHLPVIEDGKLVGILSIGDALKWLISAQTATIEHLEQYITGGYPS
jgi:CBS domain-containing protein